MSKFFVYMYLDKNTNEPFYVGKGQELRWKVDYHIYDSNKNMHLKRKIEKLGKSNIEIKKIPCENEIKAIETEKQLISSIGRHDLGKGPLCNMTNGGDGLSGYRWTDEQKLRKSIEVREYFKTHPNPFKGKHHTEESLNKYFRNKKATKETREKISLAIRGEKSPNAKLTEEKVRKIREIYNNYILINKKSSISKMLALDFQVSIPTINDVIKYRSWKHVL